MHIVIDVNDELVEYFSNHNSMNDDGWFSHSSQLLNAFRNGTQLPKGHKRLIEDNFKVGPVFDEEGHRVGYWYVTQEDLNSAQTIIEADKGGAE